MFAAEHISMDVLVEMTHESLKDIGVSAYGHRHKILRGIKDLQARIPERRKQKGAGEVVKIFVSHVNNITLRCGDHPSIPCQSSKVSCLPKPEFKLSCLCLACKWSNFIVMMYRYRYRNIYLLKLRCRACVKTN